MKQKTAALTAFLASIFIIVACNDEKVDTESKEPTAQTSTGNMDHLRMYFEGLHPADQRAFFSGLPAEMKHALVKSHWQHQLSAVKKEEEKNFIQGLINSLKPEYYKDSGLYQKEGAPFYDDQARKAFALFGNDTARVVDLLYKVGGNDKAARVIAVAGMPDCECNIPKGYCTFFGNCGTFDCKTDWWGCGPGFLEKCDGMCLKYD